MQETRRKCSAQSTSTAARVNCKPQMTQLAATTSRLLRRAVSVEEKLRTSLVAKVWPPWNTNYKAPIYKHDKCELSLPMHLFNVDASDLGLLAALAFAIASLCLLLAALLPAPLTLQANCPQTLSDDNEQRATSNVHQTLNNVDADAASSSVASSLSSSRLHTTAESINFLHCNIIDNNFASVNALFNSFNEQVQVSGELCVSLSQSNAKENKIAGKKENCCSALVTFEIELVIRELLANKQNLQTHASNDDSIDSSSSSSSALFTASSSKRFEAQAAESSFVNKSLPVGDLQMPALFVGEQVSNSDSESDTTTSGRGELKEPIVLRFVTSNEFSDNSKFAAANNSTTTNNNLCIVRPLVSFHVFSLIRRAFEVSTRVKIVAWQTQVTNDDNDNNVYENNQQTNKNNNNNKSKIIDDSQPTITSVDLVTVRPTLVYSSAEFAATRLFLQMLFLAIVVVTLAWLCALLFRFPLNFWSLEQKWTLALLAQLALSNKPLQALNFLLKLFSLSFENTVRVTQLTTCSKTVSSVVELVIDATFFASVLLFWLCFAHGLRQIERKFCTFYLPKLALVAPLWLSIIWQAMLECNGSGSSSSSSNDSDGLRVLSLSTKLASSNIANTINVSREQMPASWQQSAATTTFKLSMLAYALAGLFQFVVAVRELCSMAYFVRRFRAQAMLSSLLLGAYLIIATTSLPTSTSAFDCLPFVGAKVTSFGFVLHLFANNFYVLSCAYLYCPIVRKRRALSITSLASNTTTTTATATTTATTTPTSPPTTTTTPICTSGSLTATTSLDFLAN